MIVVALVLLLVVALVVAGVLLSSPAVHDLSVLRVLVPVTDAGMFLAGAIATLLAVLAVVLLRSGIGRSRARRRQARALSSGRTAQAAPKPTPPSETSAASTSAPAPAPTPEPGRLEQPTTDSAERARLLDEAVTLTRDDPAR